MAKQPRDMFDDVPTDSGRIGAHRAPAAKGRGWFVLLWAVLATVVLVLAGTFALSALRGETFLGGGDAESTLPPQQETVDPVTDPSTIDPARAITITVLNGTPTVNLETTAGTQLTAGGWPVGTTALASSRTVEETIVYYSNPLDEDVARGVALALGTESVLESTAFLGAPITVVLGNDFAPAPAV